MSSVDSEIDYVDIDVGAGGGGKGVREGEVPCIEVLWDGEGFGRKGGRDPTVRWIVGSKWRWV
jgi:hypothetical protein